MVLYIEGRRITAAAYSDSCSTWAGAGMSDENLAKETVFYESLEEAESNQDSVDNLGEYTLTLARSLADTLDGATLPASESDVIGRIVIFADGKTAGLPSKEACVEALGLKGTVNGFDLSAESTLTAKDWFEHAEVGFCYQDQEDREGVNYDSEDDRKMLETTQQLAAELTDHFEYNMTDEICCAPILYGGRRDKAIIAVLGMRVWT